MSRPWLRDARRAKNLSTNDLAARLNVARQQVSAWETGEKSPSREMTYLLIDELGQHLHKHFADEARAHKAAS